jgi:hypothetical protein
LACSTFNLFAIVKRIVDAKVQFRSLAEPWADPGTSGAAERGHPTSRRGRYAALLILAGISTEADLNVNPQNTAKQEVTRVIDGWRRSRLRCR